MDAQQVQNAIEIAWNPTADQSLKAQAFDFLEQLRANPSAWHICLNLFTQEPRLDEIIRHVALDLLNNAVSKQQIDLQSSVFAKDSLMDYVRRTYANPSPTSSADSPSTQNKVAQTLTFLFTTLYPSSWPSFFQDFRVMAQQELQNNPTNVAATLFYLRMLASVHDEIADQLINTAIEKREAYTNLKDQIRINDATDIAASWQMILAKWREIDPVVTELCLKTISRWVSWSDISLVVNQEILSFLYEIAGQEQTGHPFSSMSRIRDAAINVFTEIIAKKMPSDEKVGLLQILNLDQLVGKLVACPSLLAFQGTSDYDTDMAETVAKLVDAVVLDIVKALDDNLQDEMRAQAVQLLQAFTPYLLRFLSDEYDEVSSTVIPALSDQLGLLRRIAKSTGPLKSPYAEMLPPILDALIAKMRFDDTITWGEEDEESFEADFQELRKRLRICQQIVAVIDEPLYLKKLSEMIEKTLVRHKTKPARSGWRDLELALVELFLVGDLATRNAGPSQKKVPSSAASIIMVHLMTVMLESNVTTYGHAAVQLQVMDICVRFHFFFDQQKQYLQPMLRAFVQFCHSDHVKVKYRAWHNFLRFIRSLRSHLATLSESIILAIGDLLLIQAELKSPDEIKDDDSSSQKGQIDNPRFQSQLYLFEAVGCLASISSLSPDSQIAKARLVLHPLINDIRAHLELAASGDERAMLQIYQLVEAVGTLSKGFSDWIPGKTSAPVSDRISEEFIAASEIVLAALDTLRGSMIMRSAARFAFSRMIGVLGFKILQQLPRWIEGLLSTSSSRDEMATFLRLLCQVIFGFKTEIHDILDMLFTPLMQRIIPAFNEPTEGTDDEIQQGELRREYLNFLGILMNNNLASVLVSSTNQGTFDTILTTIEHFAKDTGENTSDSKLAVSVLTKMCDTWGGPNITNPSSNPAAPAPALPGFDRFMLTRFSALTWSIITNPGFDSKDASANRVLGEIATLQQTILAKTGQEYLTWLRDVELRNLGLQQTAIDEYIHAMSTTDSKTFKQFILRFLAQGGR